MNPLGVTTAGPSQRCVRRIIPETARSVLFCGEMQANNAIVLRSVPCQQYIHPAVLGPPLHGTIGGNRLHFAIGATTDLAG